MKTFIQVIREINYVLDEVIVFENILNSILLFLSVYFLLTLIGYHPLYATIPTAVYLITMLYIKLRQSKPQIVESKYTPLKEKLRTAADYVNVENPVVDELELEVTREIKNVGVSSFFNFRSVSYRILATAILSFLILFASVLNINVLDLSNRFKNNVPNIFEGTGLKGRNFIATQLNTSEEIYGEASVAQLGNNQLNIKIRPVDYKVNVKEEGEVEERHFEEVFPEEVFVEKASAFEENIPQEQQELVKNYFKKLAQG